MATLRERCEMIIRANRNDPDEAYRLCREVVALAPGGPERNEAVLLIRDALILNKRLALGPDE